MHWPSFCNCAEPPPRATQLESCRVHAIGPDRPATLLHLRRHGAADADRKDADRFVRFPFSKASCCFVLSGWDFLVISVNQSDRSCKPLKGHHRKLSSSRSSSLLQRLSRKPMRGRPSSSSQISTSVYVCLENQVHRLSADRDPCQSTRAARAPHGQGAQRSCEPHSFTIFD